MCWNLLDGSRKWVRTHKRVRALSAIIAFVTPVGVPSTALVYSTGRVSKSELIKAGVVIAIPTLSISLLAVLVLPVP